MPNKSRFSLKKPSGLQVLLWIACSLFLAACGTMNAPTTPDVDALVTARLTEVAGQRETQADLRTRVTATPIPPDGETDAESSTPSNSETDTETETEPDPSEPAVCTVLTSALNVRTGPDVIFAPVAVLQQGTEFVPDSIHPDGTFIHGVAANGAEGWISARPDLVSCPQGLDGLTIDAGPPTPTPTPTTVASATPTPTPTQAVAVVIPRAGGGDGDLTGDVVTAPGIFIGPAIHPIFRERIVFQILVNYPDAENGNGGDGAGIDFVEVFVTNDDTGDLVYEARLENPPYCALGGSGPCSILTLGAGVRWPGTNDPIETGDYSIDFSVVPTSDDADGGNWRIEFSIWLPGDAPPPFADLRASFSELMRGPDEVVFQVQAWYPLQGNQDGDGIANVRHQIFDPNDNLVYEKVETDPAYCAFGGDEPCVGHVFSVAGNRWPNGTPVENGSHRLVAIVTGSQAGRIRTFEETIDIYLDPVPEADTPTPPPPTALPTDQPTAQPTAPPAAPGGELYLEVVQLGDARGLVFQVVAWDPAVGQSDGAGIANVEMALIGPDGDLIHEQSEGGAPYCLFSNAPNSSTCNMWSFNQNDFRWPNGDEIASGEYRLRARANSEDGGTRTLEFSVQISQN